VREPRRIRVECAVTGTTRADLDANLDAIRLILTELVPKKLIFDALSDRYFNAVLESFEGSYDSTTLFRGALVFVCPDPLGYKTTDEDNDHDIDEVAKTIYEPAAGVVGGTGYILPVYTLTAKNTLTDKLIKLKNVTTDEELQWTGSLAIDGTLVIDCEKWLVSIGPGTLVASMGKVTGEFPRLKPAVQNEFLVTGLFEDTKSYLKIKYTEVYL